MCLYFICIFICTYAGCRWILQYKPFLLGRWLLLIKESLYQNLLISSLLNNVSWSRNRKSQGVDGMFNKVRDPCSLERISRTPGRDFPGHLCLWVCGVHRWREPVLFPFPGWHSEDLRVREEPRFTNRSPMVVARAAILGCVWWVVTFYTLCVKFAPPRWSWWGGYHVFHRPTLLWQWRSCSWHLTKTPCTSSSYMLISLLWKSLSRVRLFATLWTIQSVRGILQARILEWVAVPFSRGSSQPWDGTQVSDSLPAEPPGKPWWACYFRLIVFWAVRLYKSVTGVTYIKYI